MAITKTPIEKLMNSIWNDREVLYKGRDDKFICPDGSGA